MRFGLRLAVPVLALFSAPLSAFAEIVRWDDQVSTFNLDNGIEVVVIEDHRATVVVHMIWYRAGSADEKPGVSGVAHFLEHLLFKATDTMEAGEFSRTVAANGGSDNAFTSHDYTAYFQRVASDRLELMMKMEADRMVNLRLTEADILTERDVIIEERNQRTENDPGALFGEQANAALYMNHRYGVPIIGWRHEMETLELEDTLEYYEQFYAPNNTILIVAGDVTPEEVKELSERHYGPLAANPDLEPRARPQEPLHNAERRILFEDPRVAQPYVRRSYIAPERDSEDQKTAAALMLGADLLGDGQTSFMSRKLQFEEKIAVFASAFYRATSLDDASFTTVVVPVEGVSLKDAEAAMDRVIAEFMETPIDLDHLNRIKRAMRASEIYAKDNVQGLANRFGRALTSGLKVKDILAWPDVVEGITEDDIKTAMRDVFNKKSSVTGWLTSGAEAAQ